MNPLRLETFWLGVNNLRLHMLRATLTALGIIFGVAAVICMLSISEGASADELRLINALGTRNIIITSVKPQEETQTSQETTNLLEYGITRDDHQLIVRTIPHVASVVPLRKIADEVSRHDKRFAAKVVGTTAEFFDVVNVTAGRGRLLAAEDMLGKKKVCVIGDEVRRHLFGYDDPVGQTLYARRHSDTEPYEVVGVLAPALTAGTPARGVEERDLNREVMIPYTTAEARYGDTSVRLTSGSREISKVQLSGLYVTVDLMENVVPVSDMVRRVFEHNHEKVDYDVRVPLARLQLAEKKKRNSQLLLGFIAGISLLVGGIGIMNIMLATVTERTREIGIRRALGAKQRDVAVQFLVETVVLSMAGGTVGVVLGCLGAWGINQIAAWGEAIIQPWAVITSFGLSVLVGVFFGMYPAVSASKLDPIEALRHE
ncbi:MAG: ABC transporter permease [bacterium]|nr:ABC transporter permease [bacterium]